MNRMETIDIQSLAVIRYISNYQVILWELIYLVADRITGGTVLSCDTTVPLLFFDRRKK